MRPTREPARNNQQMYMVTSETWGRRPLFRVDRWARLFVETLEHYRGSAYQLHAFVVMPDHFHALITPSGALERAVQFIKGGFSHRAKVELESNMEVWQKGFSDHRIRDAADFEVHLNYIHENPVKAGLCKSPSEFPYSSASGAFPVDAVPQRLKPQTMATACGAAEAAPFQNGANSELGEAAPFQNGEKSELAEAALFQNNEQQKVEGGEEVPQRLKPLAQAAAYGAAEAAPLQRSTLAEDKPAEAAPLQNGEKSELAEAVLFQNNNVADEFEAIAPKK